MTAAEIWAGMSVSIEELVRGGKQLWAHPRELPTMTAIAALLDRFLQHVETTQTVSSMPRCAVDEASFLAAVRGALKYFVTEGEVSAIKLHPMPRDRYKLVLGYTWMESYHVVKSKRNIDRSCFTTAPKERLRAVRNEEMSLIDRIQTKMQEKWG